MRRFQLLRDRDVSGVSGTGLVAEGAAFTDGGAVVRWLTGTRSTVVWDDVDDVSKIHGHGGATRVVWVDPPVDSGPLHPSVNAVRVTSDRTHGAGLPG